MKRILLYSGGFDSTVLLRNIMEVYPQDTLYCMHFNYGQPNYKMEKRCVERNCREYGCTPVYIDLPVMSWTKSNFYNKGFISTTSQELELRNLIFLSYALSYAQSSHITEVYMATLKSHGYTDTSEMFFKGINDMLEGVDSEVKVLTPFDTFEKEDLSNLAFYYDVTDKDFFTCDTPVDGKPCGSCPDCLEIDRIMKSIAVTTPAQQWSKTRDYTDPKFKKLFMSTPIEEARLYTNDVCQLACAHCYYGTNHMQGTPLSVPEYEQVIDECIKNGISRFHFSGKEPLMDDTIFKLAGYINNNYPQALYDVVTNGLLVPQYAATLKALDFYRVAVSIDDIDCAGDYRRSNLEALKAVEACNRVNLNVTVFIDLSKSNYSHVGSIIQSLCHDYGVHDFYVRAVIPEGNAEGIELLSDYELDQACQQMYALCSDHPDLEVMFCLPNVYATRLLSNLDDSNTLAKIAQDVVDYASTCVINGFSVLPETYCGRYENQITITPDGYVIGCASETSNPDYQMDCAGNVRDEDLSTLIKRGKEKALDDMSCFNCEDFDHCSFLK